MAKKFEHREDWDRVWLRIMNEIEIEFGLTDEEMSVLFYERIHDDLLMMCGDPDYENYN